eukprot:352968-Chlamydomonas_euryale.AAC.9
MDGCTSGRTRGQCAQCGQCAQGSARNVRSVGREWAACAACAMCGWRRLVHLRAQLRSIVLQPEQKHVDLRCGRAAFGRVIPESQAHPPAQPQRPSQETSTWEVFFNCVAYTPVSIHPSTHLAQCHKQHPKDKPASQIKCDARRLTQGVKQTCPNGPNGSFMPKAILTLKPMRQLPPAGSSGTT